MLKAVSKMKDGRPFLILGVSGENLTRLVAGEPVTVDVGALGGDMPPLQIAIMYGKTEEVIADQLRAAGLIGPNTKERRG